MKLLVCKTSKQWNNHKWRALAKRASVKLANNGTTTTNGGPGQKGPTDFMGGICPCNTNNNY